MPKTSNALLDRRHKQHRSSNGYNTLCPRNNLSASYAYQTITLFRRRDYSIQTDYGRLLDIPQNCIIACTRWTDKTTAITPTVNGNAAGKLQTALSA